MPQIQRVKGVATSIRTEHLGKNPSTIIQYHDTDVVSFNTEEIVLNNGGYITVTTRTRMNQASNQFGLGYHVSIKQGEMYVTFKGKTLKFYGTKRILER